MSNKGHIPKDVVILIRTISGKHRIKKCIITYKDRYEITQHGIRLHGSHFYADYNWREFNNGCVYKKSTGIYNPLSKNIFSKRVAKLPANY